jgi:hypothetical protein
VPSHHRRHNHGAPFLLGCPCCLSPVRRPEMASLSTGFHQFSDHVDGTENPRGQAVIEAAIIGVDDQSADRDPSTCKECWDSS